MKTIEEMIPVQTAVNEWCSVNKWCLVERNGHWFYISHERDIPSDWSDELRRAVCEQVIPNRELAENERRSPTGNIHQLRIRNGVRESMVLDRCGHPNVWSTPSARLCSASGWPAFHDACEQWYRAHEPKELADNEIELASGETRLFRRHEGKEQVSIDGAYWAPVLEGGPAYVASRAWFAANKPLAPNETLSSSGKRGTMSINDNGELLVTWADGQTSVFNEHKLKLMGVGENWPERLAFWEANLPKPNQFLDAHGRRWTFEMQDDGEASISCNDKEYYRIPGSTKACIGYSDWSRAAIAYRDKERARWTFEWMNDYVTAAQVYLDGAACGYINIAGERGYLQEQPTWVRTKARAMWEANQVKKPEPIGLKCWPRGYNLDDNTVTLHMEKTLYDTDVLKTGRWKLVRIPEGES